MHIALFTPGGAAEHTHVFEDISPQSDGYNLVFTTTQEYKSGTLLVLYNGIEYTPDNDFTETGPKEFTLPFDGYGANDLFPPKAGCTLFVKYIRSL